MAAAGFPSRDAFAVRLALEEAVVNAIKHGHQHDPAKVVRVAYRVSPERVVLEVEDQGAGFDVEAALARGGSGGLSGMRERAELLGGRWSVQARPGGGTRVRAELPARAGEENNGVIRPAGR